MSEKKLIEEKDVTPEQRAEIARLLEVQRAIGTSTAPCNREVAERIVSGFYQQLGFKPPKFVWFDGPKTACIEGAKILLKEAGMPVNKKNVADYAKQLLEASLPSHEEVYWVGFDDILRTVFPQITLDADSSAKLDTWVEFTKAGGWWFPTEQYCFMSERNELNTYDDQNPPALHNATGPALRTRDGVEIYCWHGTNVPKEWIMEKDKLTAETVLTWENAEQRRCAAEILGWDKVISSLNAKVIDEDPNPMTGTLIEVDLPGAPKSRFLKVKCGTGRDFVILADEQYDTAAEANAASYDIPLEVFKQMEVRT